MEALFREILASPCAQHAAIPINGAASAAAQVSAGVEEKVGEVKEKGDADESAVVEWANEIEMQRMLDSMIMGIQGGEDGNNTLDLGMLDGMGMDLNVDLGLDMDLGMTFDGGVDYARAGWDVSGAGVF
jgi:hypothetical protein